MSERSLLGKLRAITISLLDTARPAYSLRGEVMELKAVFEQAGGTISATDDIASGETITGGGVAISPKMASMCVDDFARTVQFIRGVHGAIKDLRALSPDRPVRILYAGCGPWAPLAVPLMSIFDSHTACFSLLDIHTDSIESAKKIVTNLGLEESVVAFEMADAAAYQITGSKPDLIVIEMLRAAMRSEPQVAVARNLLRQEPGAVMIPAEVHVDLALMASSSEDGGDGRERIILGNVFELNRDSVAHSFEPRILTLPEFDASKHQLMLLMTVTVYRDHSLRDHDSGITLPVKIGEKLRPGDTVEFRYKMGSAPGLTITRTALQRRTHTVQDETRTRSTRKDTENYTGG